jgi:hypothetical protein
MIAVKCVVHDGFWSPRGGQPANLVLAGFDPRLSTPSSAPGKTWMRGSSPRKTDIQGIRRYTPEVAGGS